jgi:hypothetical protein
MARQAADVADALPGPRTDAAVALVRGLWPELRDQVARVLPAWLAVPLLVALKRMLPALVQRATAAPRAPS